MAAPELEALLLVQERDVALDRLRHRRATLPERAQLDACAAQQRTSEVAVAELRGSRDVVLADERRLDDEAQRLSARAKEAEEKLYSGSIASPRELQALQADIEMLKRHRSDLEDRELEVMEQREALDAQLGVAENALAGVTEEIARLGAAIVAADSEIDVETATEESARAELAAGLPAVLLADYEKRRARNRGAGAARLVGTTCQGCHLSIPSTEAERIHRGTDGGTSTCDNCGCILVPA